MLISKFGEFPFTDIPEKTGCCNVDGCENPCSWWMCMNCKSFTCIEHQAFTGKTVPFCQLCFKDWLKKRKIDSYDRFMKYAKRNLEYIGYQLLESIRKYFSEEADSDEGV